MTDTTLVTDIGFVADDWTLGFAPLQTLDAETPPPPGLDLPADTDPGTLRWLLTAPVAPDALRIDFPSSHDGRGFTLARLARSFGFTGRLRARGPMIADQYAMARRAGFDEVEIPADLAARQPEHHWRARADWRAHDYQARLRG